MFCSYCGTANSDDARFCSSCGKQTAVVSAESSIPSQTAASSAAEVPTDAGDASEFQTIGGNPTTPGSDLRPTTQLLPAGERFANRYEIVRLIGRGGMGAVYEARDSVIDESVALKLLLAELAAQQNAVARFTREAKVSRQLSHKNIVRVHDMASFEGTLFISMELVTGTNLRRFLDGRKKQKKPLSIKELMLLARPICAAMEAAHEITVHRDLKPENILVTRDGKVKVSDFGIATLMTLSESRLTSGALGTAYYMAPEQLEGSAKIDQRADIYSLGVILYEALVGKVPVGRFKSPREYRDDVPESMEEAILRALEPDPSHRQATMTAFLSELADTTQSSQQTYSVSRSSAGDTPAGAKQRKADSTQQKGKQQADMGPGTRKKTDAPPSTGRRGLLGKVFGGGNSEVSEVSVEGLVEKGNTQLNAGKLDAAIKLFDKAIQQNKKCAAAWYGKGMAIGKKVEKEMNEGWPSVARGEMSLEELQQMGAEAADCLKYAVKLEPSNPIYMLVAAGLKSKNL